MLGKNFLMVGVMTSLLLCFPSLYAQQTSPEQQIVNQQNMIQPVKQPAMQNTTIQDKVTQLGQTLHDSVTKIVPTTTKEKYFDQYQKQLNNITPMANAAYEQTKQAVTTCLQGGCKVSITLPAMNQKNITDSLQQLHDQIYSTRLFSTTVTILAVVILFIIILVWAIALLVYKIRNNKRNARMTESREQVFHEIAGEDVNATKLDLARAYIDMQEQANARTLLQEVAEKGNPQQREEANRLLQELV